jgi:hypothetical protein
MSMWSRSRNGIRNLNRRLASGLNRGCNRWATTLQAGGHRPRQRDELRQICTLFTQYLRITKRMAKQDPHLFGPHAHRYFLDTLQRERQQEEVAAALRKVYGPPAPGEPARVSTLWTDRYFPKPKARRIFLKHFNVNYPS